MVLYLMAYICGAAEHLELAHIFGLGKAYSKQKYRKWHKATREEKEKRWHLLNSNDNLVILCHHCHNLYDGRYGVAEKIKYLRCQLESGQITSEEARQQWELWYNSQEEAGKPVERAVRDYHLSLITQGEE